MNPEKFQERSLPSPEKDIIEAPEAVDQQSENDNYGLLDPAEYRDRMLPEIVENRELDLSGNDLTIIAEYLKKQDPAYMAELKSMVLGQKSINKDVEVIIAIPSYHEGKNLEKTLRNYTKLKSRNHFEIDLLENRPEGAGAG